MKNDIDDNLRLYNGLTNIILKALCGLIAIGAFITVLVYLLMVECSWEDSLPYAALEGILAFSSAKRFSYYFTRQKSELAV